MDSVETKMAFSACGHMNQGHSACQCVELVEIRSVLTSSHAF